VKEIEMPATVYLPGKKHKYGAKRTNGYDSRKEANRAAELKILESSGKIFNLREKVPYVLIPALGKLRAVRYIADFVYQTDPDSIVVEDVKGVRTPVYKLKKRLMLHVHNIEIQEV
jgi:hypothetical protein